MLIMKNIIPILVTTGDKVVCARCAAKSKRSGEQCKKPAMRSKAVCDFHGSRSTGPRTQEGRKRCAQTKTVDGKDSRKERADKAVASTELHFLRDLRVALGLFGNQPTGWPGRKPKNYRPPGLQDLILAIPNSKPDKEN